MFKNITKMYAAYSRFLHQYGCQMEWFSQTWDTITYRKLEYVSDFGWLTVCKMLKLTWSIYYLTKGSRRLGIYESVYICNGGYSIVGTCNWVYSAQYSDRAFVRQCLLFAQHGTSADINKKKYSCRHFPKWKENQTRKHISVANN